MSKTTTKLNLVKPELTDAADITSTNDNWDKLDDVILSSGGTMEGDFKAEKGIEVGDTIVSDTPLTDDIGTPKMPFGSMHSKHYNIYSHPDKECGEMSVHITGTTDRKGEAVISAGNEIPEGVDGNSRGRVRLFGANKGYVDVISGNESDTNYEILLPNGNGTLALEGGVAKIAVGSYVGTSTFGKNNPITITTNFKPKILLLSQINANVIYWATDALSSFTNGDTTYPNHLTWSEDGVSWYNDSNPISQFNNHPYTYYYYILG